MGTITAVPRAQSDSFRRQIERQIHELELRIVPGLNRKTTQLLTEQLLALEAKLKPLDDKRDPKHFRTRRQKIERAPVIHWNLTDYVAAKWGARQRSGGLCEICRAVPHQLARIHTAPPDADLNRDHVECVCAVCADQFPRPDFFATFGVDKMS